MHAGQMKALAHGHALAEARSCLAALADTTATFDALLAYEHVLLHLDAVEGGSDPGIEYPAESAIEALVAHGVDALSVELLLAMLADAGKLDLPGPAESG